MVSKVERTVKNLCLFCCKIVYDAKQSTVVYCRKHYITMFFLTFTDFQGAKIWEEDGTEKQKV